MVQRYRLHSGRHPRLPVMASVVRRDCETSWSLSVWHPIQNKLNEHDTRSGKKLCFPNHDTSKETLRSCMHKYGFLEVKCPEPSRRRPLLKAYCSFWGNIAPPGSP